MAIPRKLRDPRRGAVESQPLRGPSFGPIIAEGSDAGAGVTAIALSVGSDLTLAPGEPGIPFAVPGTLRYVAASWMSGSAPSGDWTLVAWLRRVGEPVFVSVATFPVNTS